MCYLNQLLCLLDVLFDWIVGTIKHDGGKSCFDTFIAAIVSTMVQMQGNRNRDVQFFHHGLNHGSNCLKSCHILSCALGYAQDNRRFQFFCCQQYGLGPLQVVDVKLANCVLAFPCFFKHVFC